MLCSLLQTSAVPAFAADAAGGVNISGATDLTDDTNPVATTGTYKISGARQNPVKITAQGEDVYKRQVLQELVFRNIYWYY